MLGFSIRPIFAPQLQTPDELPHKLFQKEEEGGGKRNVGHLAINVEFWWLWVGEILTDLAVDDVTQHWLTHTLLPVVYWHQQLHKTKNSKQREKYQQVWQRAVHALQADAFSATLPESEMQR